MIQDQFYTLAPSKL